MNRFLPTILAGLILLPALTLRAQEEDVFPPRAFPPERYEAMQKRSPFVLPSFAEDVQVTANSNWTNDYQIVSVLQVAGEAVVLVRKVSTNERIPVRSQKNAQGIRLLKLNLSPDPAAVSAILEMNGEEGTIQYDPAILSGAPHPSATGNPALKPE